MKLHSDLIGYTGEIRKALQEEKNAGRVASHVTLKKVEPHGSRIRQFGFEVQLQADERDNGRRAGNSGSYGAMIPEYDGFAATYDEWGWLIAALYKLDPKAVWGSPSAPQYENLDDFDKKTGMTYNPAALLDSLMFDGDPFPYTVGYTANRVGRRGFGRINAQQAEQYRARGYTRHLKEAPRDEDWVRTFAHLEAATV